MFSRPCSGSVYFTLTAVLFFSIESRANSGFQELIDSYIKAWTDFYPSLAFSQGLKPAAWRFEDFSDKRVRNWLQHNHRTATAIRSLSGNPSLDQRVDMRVLLRQTRLETEHWERDRVLDHQPEWYAELISHALTYVLVREQLTPGEKFQAVLQRLQGIWSLCDIGIRALVNGSRERTLKAVQTLEGTAKFYETDLLKLTRTWVEPEEYEQMRIAVKDTTLYIRRLANHIRNNILPVASIPDSFGYESYARKLKIYVDKELTPGQLAEMAMGEIENVRKLMATEAYAWLTEKSGNDRKAKDEATLLTMALTAMEDDRTDNRREFLESFDRLTQQAENFLTEHALATVPQPRTLYIALSPDHFSGAAVGGVYPAGPFDPEANTLFYLPSVSEDASDKEKDGFYRSFNNHFNTMIISHEIFPGHYMQSKVAIGNVSPVRSLFTNDVYVEGWGSFSELLMLDHGWANRQRLTRLAHLRKRLENATRAYISVMVHTKGWDKKRVMEFATTRGLLAPQFAVNLWHRVMNNPLQLTTYFLGFHGFNDLWKKEKTRLGNDFVTKDFVDAVLRAGPVAIDALESILQQ